jgi:hypothetical protein
MSRIAPDIPELAHFPEVVRSLIWTRAMVRAIRSPSTWAIGATGLVVLGLAGAAGGRAVSGALGAMLGGLLGGGGAVYALMRFVIPWRSRRLVPVVERESDWSNEFDDVIRAADRLKVVGRSADP